MLGRVNWLLRPNNRSVLVWLVVFLGLPSLYSVKKFTGFVGLVLYIVALQLGSRSYARGSGPHVLPGTLHCSPRWWRSWW